MGFQCSGCVIVLLGNFLAFLSNLKVAVWVKGQARPFPFYTPRDPKLHPTPEVHHAVPLSSIPHKI